jgi:hypothetical protein
MDRANPQAMLQLYKAFQILMLVKEVRLSTEAMGRPIVVPLPAAALRSAALSILCLPRLHAA